MIPKSIVSERGTVSMRTFMFMTARVLIAAASILIATRAVSSAGASSLSGMVQTGGTASAQPLPNVSVTLLELFNDPPTTVGQARPMLPVDSRPLQEEEFIEHLLCQSRRRRGCGVHHCPGPNLPASVTINELTTVAASYSMAQFYRTGVISGNRLAYSSLRA
jgi:hypothetical protein